MFLTVAGMFRDIISLFLNALLPMFTSPSERFSVFILLFMNTSLSMVIMLAGIVSSLSRLLLKAACSILVTP